MGSTSHYSLQRTMIIYFLLIGFASMLVGVEFLAEFHGGELGAEIWDRIDPGAGPAASKAAVLAPIERLRSKAILMVAIIMVVMVIVLTMFIKHITEPLQHMIRKSRQISHGDLSQTVRIEANNELKELGTVINEMSSNLQEIILLSQRTCTNGRQRVNSALDRFGKGAIDADGIAQLKKDVETIGGELSNLSEMVEFFNFYSVDKTQAPGQHHDDR
jgi:methyl-accepting chemotaxis protein